VRDIVRTVDYPVAPAEVWQALTDPAAIGEWLMPNDFVARLGHEFTLRGTPVPGWDGVVHCVVTELDPPRRMVWSWRSGKVDTVVSFDLEQTPTGTRLRFRQSGFRGPAGAAARWAMGGGWPRILERVGAIAARQAPR
jgi:uncharacterized protein YndB with AHSA1/START domain